MKLAESPENAALLEKIKGAMPITVAEACREFDIRMPLARALVSEARDAPSDDYTNLMEMWRKPKEKV